MCHEGRHEQGILDIIRNLPAQTMPCYIFCVRDWKYGNILTPLKITPKRQILKVFSSH